MKTGKLNDLVSTVPTLRSAMRIIRHGWVFYCPNFWNGCVLTNTMKLTPQNVKYLLQSVILSWLSLIRRLFEWPWGVQQGEPFSPLWFDVTLTQWKSNFWHHILKNISISKYHHYDHSMVVLYLNTHKWIVVFLNFGGGLLENQTFYSVSVLFQLFGIKTVLFTINCSL